jgi:hypothetical protein
VLISGLGDINSEAMFWNCFQSVFQLVLIGS